MTLEAGEDKLRQNWYSDEYFLGVAKGSIRTQDQAWEYFRQSIFIDYESDNYNLYVQFSDDPSYTWGRMSVDLEKMFGKQYVITTTPPSALPTLSSTQPPSPPQSYWLIHKYLKSASRPPPSLGSKQSVSSRSIQTYGQSQRTGGSMSANGVNVSMEGLAILETFVILGKWVYKASSLADLLGGKLTTATNLISSSLDLIRTQVARARSSTESTAIGFQRDPIWLSAPMGGLPGTAADDKVGDAGAVIGLEDAKPEGEPEGREETPAEDSQQLQSQPGKKRKRPPSSTPAGPQSQKQKQDKLGAHLAIRNAVASTRAGSEGILAERERCRMGTSLGMDN